MTEHEIRDRILAEFDRPDPGRVELKQRCREVAEVQWWAREQLELLHIFDSPRCVLTRDQFAIEWNNHALAFVHWPTLSESTVAEAIARDQLKLLRGSLGDMLEFLKGREPKFSRPRPKADWLKILKELGEPIEGRTFRRHFGKQFRTPPGTLTTAKKVSIALDDLPPGYSDAMTVRKTKATGQ